MRKTDKLQFITVQILHTVYYGAVFHAAERLHVAILTQKEKLQDY